MVCSVLIPSWQGSHKLPALLAALRTQSVQADEILVALDGPDSESLQLLERWSQLLPQLRALPLPHAGKGATRNRAAAASRGDLLCFLDDDMLPPSGWLAAHRQHHALGRAGVLSGPTPDGGYDQPNEMERWRQAQSRLWHRAEVEAYPDPLPPTSDLLPGANFSVSRQLFDQLGRFREDLPDGEDLEFCHRLHAAGQPLYYAPRAAAFHRDRITARSAAQRSRGHFAADALLRELGIHRIKPWHAPGWRARLLGCRPLFRPLTSDFWLTAIDRRWLGALPERWRHRIYTAIFHARDLCNTAAP